jgi:hypothetical protein
MQAEKGFTLIELLVIAGITIILVALALPDLVEPQTQTLGSPISSLLANRILVLTALSGIFIQVVKVILSLFIERRVNFRRLIETGGMPSSHSASVSALSTLVGLRAGFDSLLFAVTTFFSLIVMYDAAGLRRAAGKQARALNLIIEDLQLHRQVEDARFRELLGHTPLEVLMGALFGIAFALAFFR